MNAPSAQTVDVRPAHPEGPVVAAPLNMSGNLPPKAPHVFDEACRSAIARVLAEHSPNDLFGAHQFKGSERDRAAGAAFVARRLPVAPEADRVVVANGTQSLLVMLLAGLVGQGGTLAIEALTYPTIGRLAETLGIGLAAVPIDAEGVIPDAFEGVCRSRRPAALYVMPSLHNPTTAIMGPGRRAEVAEICRRYGVAIIEDDIYSLLPQHLPPPLSTYAPEISWYVLGTAKAMVAALKVAYVVAPSAMAAADLFWPGGRETFWMCAPINAAVASILIEEGAVGRILDAVRAETRERQRRVAERLAGADLRTMPECLHVWLTLPEDRSRTDFVAAVAARGVTISPSDIYALSDAPRPNAVRFGTGAPRDRASFERGLEAIAHAYETGE